MRAHTEGKDDMGRRFAIVIGAAAAGVMALGAQTTAAAPDVVKYDTELTITKDGGGLYHGGVQSDRDRNPEYDPANAVTKCMDGRRVTLFKRRPGADRKLGTARSKFRPDYGEGIWGVEVRQSGLLHRGGVYVKVKPKVRDGYVCRADRSETMTGGGAKH
jgi:hypothetical protein